MQLIPPRVRHEYKTAQDRGEEFVPGDPSSRFDADGLQTLTAGLRPSIDYIDREFQEFAHVEAIHVVPCEPLLEGIDARLAELLGLEVITLPAAPQPSIDEPLRPLIESSEGHRYAAAIGLALRNAVSLDLGIPRIDLFAAQRSATKTLVHRRNLAGSAFVSVAAVVLGVTGFLLYHRQITTVEAERVMQEVRASTLRTQANIALAEHARRVQQYQILRKDGIPVTAVMDSLAAGLSPGVGLRTVAVGEAFNLNLTAEAVDEASMLTVVEQLQLQPSLLSLNIKSFTAENKPSHGLVFTASGTTVSIDQVGPHGTNEVASR
jgi:hypothetical protein